MTRQKSDSDGYTDIHCHCLPALDDGPETDAQALVLCADLVDDGITTVIATPHQLGKYGDSNNAEKIRRRVRELDKLLKSNNIPLTVLPGADVRVDERICRLLADDTILTLADGGRYVLLELPHEIFLNIEPLLEELASNGFQAIISHPERHRVLARHPEILFDWFSYSACFQITAGSLLGGFGSKAKHAAWHFLKSGYASIVATDSHDSNGRRPCMKTAYERINAELGRDIAQMVCVENPMCVLKGQDITVPEVISGRAYGY